MVVGDCRAVMAGMEPASVSAVVCDPPYDLTTGKKGGSGERSLNLAHPGGRARITTGGGFMGKSWDATGIAFDPATWEAVKRVLVPGGVLMAFGGTRTEHRMKCAIEDAGFVLFDTLLWLHGQGFPKHRSLLKPAFELIAVAKKPGAGGLNTEAARLTQGAPWPSDPACTPLPSLDSPTDIDASDPRPVQDALRRIASELRGSSTAGTILSRGAALPDDTSPSGAGCGGTRSGPSPSEGGRGHRSSEAQGSPGDYPTCRGSGDALFRRVRAAAREGAPSLADALERIASDLSTPSRTPMASCSDHPSIAGDLALLASLAALLSSSGIPHIQPSRGRSGEASAFARYADRGGTDFAPTPGPRGGSPQGRWPANVALSHLESCREVGMRRVKGSNGRAGGNVEHAAFGGGMRNRGNEFGYADPDGYETTVAYECADGCPVAMLDAQAGERGGGFGVRGKGGKVYGGGNGYTVDMRELGQTVGYGDIGGPSRFFFVARPDSSTYTVEEQEAQPCGDESTTDASTSAGKRTASSDDNSPADGLGSSQTALFPSDTRFTTETRTRSTTISTTSNACPPDGTTTTTSESGRTTALSMVSKNGAASDAENTNPSTDSSDGRPEPTRDTVSAAHGLISANGEPLTESTTTPICAPIESELWTKPRFFYTSKASSRERTAGLNPGERNLNPCVKPLALCEWILKLAVPPGGSVLDPFAGSGSMGCAAARLGIGYVGIEQDAAMADQAERRIAFFAAGGDVGKGIRRGGANATISYGKMRLRRCNVCGTKAKESGPSGRWPNCDHDDWAWVEQGLPPAVSCCDDLAALPLFAALAAD